MVGGRVRKVNNGGMKIYLIRHGETDFNRQGIVQGGGVDSDLNELGRRQTVAFYQHYRHVQFDAIYASPLKRTHQTVRPWLEASGLTLSIEPGLTELSWGILEGRTPTEDQNRNFRQLKLDWEAGQSDRRVEGGESPRECWDRLQAVLVSLKSRHLGQTILVCSHGRASRVLLSMVAGSGLQDMEKFPHSNTGLNILSLQEDGTMVAERINDTQHLDGVIEHENNL